MSGQSCWWGLPCLELSEPVKVRCWQEGYHFYAVFSGEITRCQLTGSKYSVKRKGGDPDGSPPKTRAMARSETEVPRSPDTAPDYTMNVYADSFIMPQDDITLTAQTDTDDPSLSLSPDLSSFARESGLNKDIETEPLQSDSTLTDVPIQNEQAVKQTVLKGYVSPSRRPGKRFATCAYCGWNKT